MARSSAQPFWPAVMRGVAGRCPRCGKGRLFAGYLKPAERCAVCGEALGHIRADDGPAWLTILVTGHMLAPFLLGVVPRVAWPTWTVMTGAVLLALVLMLSILPRAKGFFIGMIWRSGCSGAEH